MADSGSTSSSNSAPCSIDLAVSTSDPIDLPISTLDPVDLLTSTSDPVEPPVSTSTNLLISASNTTDLPIFTSDSTDLPTSTSDPADLPISMQTSTPFNKRRLDIMHGEGGHCLPTEEESLLKRLKTCPSFPSSASMDSSHTDDQDSQSSVDEGAYGVINYANGESYDLRSDMDERLEFDILDEDSDDGDEECNSSDFTNTESEYEINPDEIDAMLDEGLKCPKKKDCNEDDELAHEEKEKVILKVKGRDHFDVLPEGWIEVTHNSGMPVYLHKQTRVCSLSKPYFLGPGSARKHEIPISAIPCLQYLKELEKEKQCMENGSTSEPAVENGNTNIIIPNAKLESVQDSKKEGSLDYLAVREYCKRRFQFSTITVKRFKTWFGRRKHLKQLKQKQRPTLPENTKLITCPLPPVPEKGQTSSNNNNAMKREFIMNPSGKSAVCILHEYVQHTLRVQPRYVFKELENASTPYGAVVVINNMEYGSGFGSSKKQAKSEAAKSALEILIPKMRLFASDDQQEKECQDMDFFDQVRVEDPRVCDLCVKAGQPYPYQILLECLKRNYGMGNTDIHFEMKNLKHQKNEFTMSVGKHTTSVICRNKRDGKQRASQAILQLLHPQIMCWGSLLRMYGVGSRQTLKEKKVEEQRITELQSKACANKPNLSILNKLKEEMLKHRMKKDSMKPIGKLIPQKLEFMCTSDSNLKNVEL